MGLALLDVADVIRPYPQVVSVLEHADDDQFVEALPSVPGGREAADAIRAWLEKYGMRGAGEVDITRPRWSESPRLLLPVLLGNIRNVDAGEAKRRFTHGQQIAAQKQEEIVARVRMLPEGEQKAEQIRLMIDRVRTFIGYREYPKYAMVSRYFVYKQALLREAGRLVAAGVLREKDDIFFLTFDELRQVVRTNRVDAQLIRERREAFRLCQALTPPRVLTSDGEAIAGSYQRDRLPEGALAGLAVSAGVVEGRARVVLDMADAELEPGDVLVTACTDPSWTPLFVAISGLVTEVGGLMTHGAVIAREYGLPAVVGVQGATRLIRDGQRVRVHGTEGYVEILR
jgi:pyruvate,water dikinase